MESIFDQVPFRPADILLPRDVDLSLWSVIACDQYTSEPEYWQRVGARVGKAPSALRLILPESRLEEPGIETEIVEINHTMTQYLRDGIFRKHPSSFIYVERTLRSGQVRRGVVGMIDLEQYRYENGAASLVRATEETVLSRIPPRVAVRKHAQLELPHVMLLADDPECTLVEPLAAQTGEMEPLYDFELMEGGGHLRGWRLGALMARQLARAQTALMDQAQFDRRYSTHNAPVMLFAVGDGNHSLATAKECYERRKRLTRPEQWPDLPSRFCLVEINNIHDTSLHFEPIHRLLSGVEPEALLRELLCALPEVSEGVGAGQLVRYAFSTQEGCLTFPEGRLALRSLQAFLDAWLLEHRQAGIDYIHGEQTARSLAAAEGKLAFLLPEMHKSELFPAIIRGGVLPRKTFSIGHAEDKRYYLEARKIRK